jgi:tetratricopeptide (TPR) repeat protein
MKNAIPDCSQKCCDMTINWLSSSFLVLLFLLLNNLAVAQGLGAGKANEANTAARSRDFKRAIDLYKEAIKAEPNNSKYWFKMGQCQMNLRQESEYDNAINSFLKATEFNPSLTSAYVNIYKLYAKKKDANNAIKYLRLAYEKESDQQKKIQYKVLSAKFYLTQDKNQEALRELQDAKALSPNDVSVLYTEGDINGKMGNWTQALDSYTKALELVNKIPGLKADKIAKYKVGVALAYCKLGKNAEFDKIYNELTGSPLTKKYGDQAKRKCKGESNSLPIRLATAYMKASEFDEAKKYANQAVASGQNLATAYKVLALVHVSANEPNLAITAFTKAVQAEPDAAKQAKLNNTMVKLQFRNGDYQGALTTANRILEKGANTNIMFLKAQAEYKLGKYNDCVSTVDQVIQKIKAMPSPPPSKEMAKYYFQLGLAAKKANQVAKAKEAFKQAQQGIFAQAAKNELTALGAN